MYTYFLLIPNESQNLTALMRWVTDKKDKEDE